MVRRVGFAAQSMLISLLILAAIGLQQGVDGYAYPMLQEVVVAGVAGLAAIGLLGLVLDVIGYLVGSIILVNVDLIVVGFGALAVVALLVSGNVSAWPVLAWTVVTVTAGFAAATGFARLRAADRARLARPSP